MDTAKVARASTTGRSGSVAAHTVACVLAGTTGNVVTGHRHTKAVLRGEGAVIKREKFQLLGRKEGLDEAVNPPRQRGERITRILCPVIQFFG
jgi:hypothetical protein